MTGKPYGLRNLCSGWCGRETQTHRAMEKPTYRAVMIVETYFGPFVIPGRVLDGPVTLSSSRHLAALFGDDFVPSLARPGQGRLAPKFKRAKPSSRGPGRRSGLSSARAVRAGSLVEPRLSACRRGPEDP